jgi:co-chaperonin GroES (HSP10)
MIIPDGFRVLVKQDVFEEKDEVYKSAKNSGLILVHDKSVRAQESVDSGVVVLLGATADKTSAKVGDKIVYAKFAGKKVDDPQDPNTVYVIINDDDICAIIKE